MKISSHLYGIAYHHRDCGNTTIIIRSESLILTNLRRIFQILRQSTCHFPQHTGDCSPITNAITVQVCHRICKYTTFFENECKNSGKVYLLLFCKPLAGTGTLESQSPRFSFSQMLPRCELNLGCTALCASHHAITLQKYNKYSEYFGPIWSFFI